MKLALIIFWITFWMSAAQAEIGNNLRGYYKLSSYEVKNSKIEITLTGMDKYMLCGKSDDQNNKNSDLLKRIMATKNNKIEITANAHQECIEDIQEVLSASEIEARVDKAMSSLLGGAEFHIRDFENDSLKSSNFPDGRNVSAYSDVLVIPYGKAAVRSIDIYWDKHEPNAPLEYQVSQIDILENTPDELGHKEYHQGSDDWGKLPFAKTKRDINTEKLIRKIDRAKKFNLFKKLGDTDKVQVFILDKQTNFVVKRIERGDCSGDREITTVIVDKKTLNVLGPKTESLSGGECPD